MVVVDSRLALEARARQALVGLYPILALVPPTLVDPPTPTLVASRATGSQTASLTGVTHFPELAFFWSIGYLVTICIALDDS